MGLWSDRDDGLWKNDLSIRSTKHSLHSRMQDGREIIADTASYYIR
jgi:hypothetical protein